MKKFIAFICIALALFIIIGIGKLYHHSPSTHLTKVSLAEVAHSVFYAPQYLADSLGYFEDEGLEVDITLANGADAVMASVLSGDADIGFCGTEATIYVVGKKRK